MFVFQRNTTEQQSFPCTVRIPIFCEVQILGGYYILRSPESCESQICLQGFLWSSESHGFMFPVVLVPMGL